MTIGERSRGAERHPAVATLAAHGVTAAHEVLGKTGLLDPAIHPIQQGVRVAGPAVTVLCPRGGQPDDSHGGRALPPG